MVRGRFIALEGPKGVGKTTLCAALAERITGTPGASKVLITKEPTPRFDLGNEQRLTGLALAKAIAADRRWHVDAELEPALAAGRTVICDRYILSSYIFHTGDGVAEDVIDRLNESFPLPTLNVVLYVPADALRERLNARSSATRLQKGSTNEFSLYIRYAERMRRLDVPYKIANNADIGDQEALTGWLVNCCTGGLP
ncbi:dTMP kinase [Thermomonospora echinospora]|uniref:Thymidylate kinase n=1 Tax=Thermomonospora echinospora TaxID=1992 RepID=A0A1H6E3Y7_9ACTN|nr:AAA family ATPase [Thermomonospora echinospora]SEG91754.1 dTMP kinase [Thermomonospora echinospora]